MIKRFVFISFIFFSVHSLAQIIPNLPMALGIETAVVWGDSIYVFGGATDYSGSTRSQNIYKFDGNSWSVQGSIPDDKVCGAIAVLADNDVYLLGGYPDGATLNRKYSLITKQWTTMTPSTNTSDYNFTAQYMNGKIYLFDPYDVGRCLAYNIAGNSWTVTDLIDLNGVPSSTLYNDEIYFAGLGANYFAKYSPVTDIWTDLAVLPYEPLNCAMGIVKDSTGAYKDSIYCIGGWWYWGGSADFNKILIYEVSTGQWKDINDCDTISSKRCCMATAEYRGGLYIIGGFDKDGNAVNIVEQIVPQSITGVEDEIMSLDRFYLSQNYPNPFNPSTKITYNIAEHGYVSLKVYDVLGSEIGVLVNEEKSSGEFTVEFSATNIPSGVYFYQMKAGDFIQIKKMILMK